MADFLTAVKTIHLGNEDEKKDELLSVVDKRDKRLAEPVNDKFAAHPGSETSPRRARTPQEAVQILRSQPSEDEFIVVLEQLRNSQSTGWDFDLNTSEPLQAQLLNTLLTKSIPTFWSISSARHKKLFVDCLHTTSGVAAVVSRLRQLALQPTDEQKRNDAQVIRAILEVLDQLLRQDDHVSKVWTGLQAVLNHVKRQMAWKEYVNLITSGKIVSVTAQVFDGIDSSTLSSTLKWLADGKVYASWLGRNIARLLVSSVQPTADTSLEEKKVAAQILAKGLSLGYASSLFQDTLRHALQGVNTESGRVNLIRCLFTETPLADQRKLVDHLVKWLSGLSHEGTEKDTPSSLQTDRDVSGTAALLRTLLQADVAYLRAIIALLSNPSASTWMSLPVRRACIAAISEQAPDELHNLLEQLVPSFGDQLFIIHAPILQQERFTQTVLLTAGAVSHLSPVALRMTARSSHYLQAISSRLDASSSRARWLGMVVGTAISSLVDKEGGKIDFGTDDMQTDKAEAYTGLVNIQDDVGELNAFLDLLRTEHKHGHVARSKQLKQKAEVEAMPIIAGKPVFGPPRPPVPSQTEVEGERIKEISDSGSDDEDDLKPYGKPDSDPEDSDEDATLVNRDKPRAPAYIRNLMAMLRDDKDHDRFQLAIQHAAKLIRRKTNFGSEVNDHAEELARILCNLQDPFETADFDELRLQALIAVVISDVTTIAPWLSRQAFAEGYSLMQRCVILSALGLAGRELAGVQNEDDLNPTLPGNDFPSKRLPPRLHAIYSPNSPPVRRLEAASKSVEHNLIQPLALRAADSSTSHLDAVKVRKFSSRVTNTSSDRTKRKSARNELAKVFGSAFFYPLVTRFQQEIAAYSSSSVFMSAPLVLVTFIKTLALLLHGSGPATQSLPQIASDFWDLLLSLRVKASGNISVLEAVLFALLTMLEILDDDKRRVAEEHGRQLTETKEWVDVIFERTGGGTGLVAESRNDDSRIRTLAAGVLVKAGEIIEAYQKLFVGSMGL